MCCAWASSTYLEAEGTLDTETGELTEPIRANVPADLAPDELTEEKARELLEQGKSDGSVLGVDPVSGNQIVARDVRYGLRHRGDRGDDRGADSGVPGRAADRILQERQAQAEEEAEARQAAHRVPVQVHGPGDRDP